MQDHPFSPSLESQRPYPLPSKRENFPTERHMRLPAMIRKIHCTHHTSLRFTLMTHNVENQAAEGIVALATN